MALEALNQIGSEQRNIIIIFNDNNMSISENVGVLTQNFAKLRASKPYNALKNDLKTALNRNNVGQAVLTGLPEHEGCGKKRRDRYRRVR